MLVLVMTLKNLSAYNKQVVTMPVNTHSIAHVFTASFIACPWKGSDVALIMELVVVDSLKFLLSPVVADRFDSDVQLGALSVTVTVVWP